MQNIRVSKLIFDNVNLTKAQTHKLRGYIGSKYKEYDLVHNHDLSTGKEIYRYPLFQFKVIEKKPYIIALGEETTAIFKKMFIDVREINIEGRKIPVYEKQLISDICKFGYAGEFITYRFINPWIALNQDNYKKYKLAESEQQKLEILQRCLVGNIISVCKGLGYSVENKLKCEIKLKSTIVNLKGNEVMGFTGFFKVNFCLPDLIGLGKSVSRGYGTIETVL